MTNARHWAVEVKRIAPPPAVWTVRSGSGIWDLVTGARRRTLRGHADTVQAVAITPDGSWLATASDDNTVRIWDPVAGSGVASACVAGPLRHLEWSGMTLVAAGAFGPYIFKLSGERPTG